MICHANYKEIIERTNDFVSEYWFENLNLRGSFKPTILSYIEQKYPRLKDLYAEIYLKGGNKEYWKMLAFEIEDYCDKNNIKYTNYFYHEELVAAKNHR